MPVRAFQKSASADLETTHRGPIAARRTAPSTAGNSSAIPRFDQRQQQHSRAETGALGKRIQNRWLTDSVDPFRRVFHPRGRPSTSPWHGLPAEGPVNPVSAPVRDVAKMSAHIKEVAKFFGADLAGVCRLLPWMVYSHRGLASDRERYGEPIALDHRFAISIGRELDYQRLRYSPNFIDGAEMGMANLESAKTAAALACYIRELGYPATAHFQLAEQVLHVPVAVAAGLGELARNNCLISKDFGPRLCLATVTTDLPLAADVPISLGVQAFCQECDKCARLCPSQGIPRGNQQVERGYAHWVNDNDRCFAYWTGNPERWNDCARCITVCPWNKPNRWWHRAAVVLVSKGRLARKALLWLDELIWNKKFHLKGGTGWLMYKRSTSAKKYPNRQIHPDV